MGKQVYKPPRPYELGSDEHERECKVYADAKWRGCWQVEYCSRSVPYKERGACVNFGEKCGECFGFSLFVEGVVCQKKK